MRAGLLPKLSPLQDESLSGYLHRLSDPQPWEEHYQVTLSAPASSWAHDLKPSELQFSSDAARCEAHSCVQFKRRCRELHPRFFGSVMVQVSLITEPFWSIFTVRDALDVAEHFSYQTDDGEGFSAFWRAAGDELKAEGVVRPTREQLRIQGARAGRPPRHLFHQIGIDEVLPALKPGLCLSIEDLERLSAGRDDVAGVIRLLMELKQLNQGLLKLYDDKTISLWCESGDYRTSPLYVLSGERPAPNRPYLHAVQELLEEEWQMAAQCEGYRENLFYSVHDAASAHKAAKLLPGLSRSFDLTRQIVEQLIDPQEA